MTVGNQKEKNSKKYCRRVGRRSALRIEVSKKGKLFMEEKKVWER